MMSSPSLSIAVPDVELVRYLCRKSFYSFVEEFWEQVPGAGHLIPNWHIEIFCDELQAIAERVFRNEPKAYDIVLNVSPGTSKSTIWSILFPAWVWTRMPHARCITASHTDDLALDLSNKSRAVIQSEKYQEAFPDIELRSDQKGKGYYINTHGGDRKTCTVGGVSPTGWHAHFIIIDDPLDPKKVLSEAEVKAAKHFITEIIPTRKVDKRVTVTCLVMQRLGLGDPTDVMLKEAEKEGAAPVRHVCLPAMLDKGDDGAFLESNVSPRELASRYVNGLMDPLRLGPEVLAEARARGALYFATQFGQKPYAMDGGMFRPEYFNQRCKAAPFHAKRILYIDRASSTKNTAANTSITLMAKDADGNYFVEYNEAGRWEPVERNKKVRSLAIKFRARYGPSSEPRIHFEEEGGSSGVDAARGFCKSLEGFPVFGDRVTGNKELRAEPWSAQLASGNVWIVDNGESKGQGKAEWDIQAFVDEHLAFPLAELKDRVDSSCLVAGTMVETFTGPKPIDQIKAGEMVLTRQGYKEVQWSGQTGMVSDLVVVRMSNGQSLVGTPEHLVWTQEMGYITLGELNTCHTLTKVDQWLSKSGRSSQIPMFDGFKGVGIHVGRESLTTGVAPRTLCIEPSGFTTMGIYPPIMTFIIRTRTLLTTTSAIWNALRKRNMQGSTQISREHQNSWRIWKRYGARLLYGIDPRKAWLGTESTAKHPSRRGSIESTNAIGAASISGLPALELGVGFAIALLDATNWQDRSGDHEREHHDRASCVERNSMLRTGSSAVPVSVEHRCVGNTPVYDLKVKDAHEFFANGVLVHNSGAFNLLAGKSAGAMRFRVINLSDKKTKGPRIVVCSEAELSNLAFDGKCLLCSIQDPSDSPTLPTHALNSLLDSVILPFADLDPADYQDRWNEPIQPYGKTCEQLKMDREHGKAFWAWLLKKRPTNADVIVLSDNGDRRAQSLALALVDQLHLPRQSIYLAAQPDKTVDKEAKALNPYVYAMARECRSMVVG